MIFLGNLNKNEEVRDCFSNLKTLSTEGIAVDWKGNILNNHKPLYISKEEYSEYNNIYDLELKRITNN